MQGYQLIATGTARYLALAAACAASLRKFDGTRPVQLVTDMPSSIDPADAGLFDVVTPCPADPTLAGPLVKLRAYALARFEETMFVDADCLLLKPDIDRFWNMLSGGYQMTVPGLWKTAGEWYGIDIAEMCRLAGTTRLVQMNSGAFYFRRGQTAASLFDEAIALYRTLGNFTGHVHGGSGPPDEPYLGLAMGRLGLAPFPMRDENCDSWMTATMNSLEVRVDAFSGHTALVKRHRVVSPTICHFTNLFPRELYRQVAAEILASVRNSGAACPAP